jgi:hypothetical protein
MTTGLWLQYGVIAALVTGSVLQVVRKLLPGPVARSQALAARVLDQPSRGRVSRSIGRWLQPAKASAGSCDDGCSSCCGCSGTPPPPEESERGVVVFHRNTPH